MCCAILSDHFSCWRYFLLLSLSIFTRPFGLWPLTYLRVEDCCCMLEPEEERWDSVVETCRLELYGLDWGASRPSGLWRMLVMVMPSLPPPIPESFFLEMFCSSGEYSCSQTKLKSNLSTFVTHCPIKNMHYLPRTLQKHLTTNFKNKHLNN